MLGKNVYSLGEAHKWLRHYTKDVGKPYPNGKGVYPDLGYCIIDASAVICSPFIDTYLDMETVKVVWP